MSERPQFAGAVRLHGQESRRIANAESLTMRFIACVNRNYSCSFAGGVKPASKGYLASHPFQPIRCSIQANVDSFEFTKPSTFFGFDSAALYDGEVPATHYGETRVSCPDVAEVRFLVRVSEYPAPFSPGPAPSGPGGTPTARTVGHQPLWVIRRRRSRLPRQSVLPRRRARTRTSPPSRPIQPAGPALLVRRRCR